GCAAAGLCGVSGSLEMLAGGSGESSSSSGGGPSPIQAELMDPTAAARVTTLGVAGAADATCTDLVPVDVSFTIRAHGGRAVATSSAFQPPSSGRCAGPTATDLEHLTLPARRTAGGYDLSGTVRFEAGPFDIQAISTLELLASTQAQPGLFGFGFTGGGATAIGRPLPTRPVLQESAEYDYRIAGLEGTLATTFAGLPAPQCRPLGACDATGTLSETFAAKGRLDVFGYRTVKRRVGRARALADLRHGRLDVSGGGDLQISSIDERVTESLTGPHPCRDTSIENPSTSDSGFHHLVDELQIAPGGPQFEPAADPLRTRCPGPGAADATGGRALAQGTIGSPQLGSRRLTVVLGGDGAFTGSGYSGRRSGSLRLTLVLVHARGGTQVVRFPIGAPGP
ncbi:MAG: hypothetical protein ACRDMJ_08475, partial [Solirubrobacteraceae bacterium]